MGPREDAQQAEAKALLQIEAPKPQPAGITFGEAVERYLQAKARKRTVTRTSESSSA